jgi:hypothetical protein
MQLKTHGDEVAVMQGRALLSAEYTPGDRGPGSVVLALVDQDTGDTAETVLRLDPWFRDHYEIIEWPQCSALLICGARQIVALSLPTLGFGAAVAVEYEEADTIERPWTVEVPELRLLIVATERRIWCLDERIAIRWLWSSRTGPDDRWLVAAPRAVGRELHVPVGTVHRDLTIELSADQGIER